MSKNIYKDERSYIVNNWKYTRKRGDYAASQPAKIYGTIGEGGKITGNITLNKNKARRAADKLGQVSGRLEHEDVQKFLGKGSKAEKALLEKLKTDKLEYTTGQAYADEFMEMKQGVSTIEDSVRRVKGTLEGSVRRTNPAAGSRRRKPRA